MSREVVERMLAAGRAMDVDAFVELMAPDGYLEWPYRPPNAPSRLQGREEIRRFLEQAATALVTFDEFRNVVVHETTDPEVIIVEYDAHGSVVATGAPFHQTVIAVFRVVDGHVAVYRDYINPLPLMEASASLR
ncbi:nuclear transport factor 2 family protein [Cryptosporangium sp. NPDC048952]|uniref:nuclear transport factor 2 family protein n=1 Tax=Cryptosporangium sp. NPDC048952 TaxID=3363961 RepID=UPI00371E9D95